MNALTDRITNAEVVRALGINALRDLSRVCKMAYDAEGVTSDDAFDLKFLQLAAERFALLLERGDIK